MKIKLKTSMAFDAICTCSLINTQLNQYHNPVQREVTEILRERGVTVERCTNFSSLGMILSAFTENKGLEDMTLDGLIAFFRQIDEVDRVVRERIRNEFLQSYLYPLLDALKDGLADCYCDILAKMKDAGFEELWREKILPVEREEMGKLTPAMGEISADTLFSVVSELKCEELLAGTTVFSCLMSYPTSFTLYGGAFLAAAGSADQRYDSSTLAISYTKLIGHELMHGFASSELTEKYRKLMGENRFLRGTHHALIHDMGSGDEEEFVMGADAYILYRLGVPSDRILLDDFYRYANAVPLSKVCFLLASREKEPVKDYNRYLLDKIDSGKLNKNFFFDLYLPEIFAVCERAEQLPEEERFYTPVFLLMFVMSYMIRDLQLDEDAPDGDSIMEEALGTSFTVSDDRKILIAGAITVESVEYGTRKAALTAIEGKSFPGTKVSPVKITYEGTDIERPYVLNFSYRCGEPSCFEASFVCGMKRYLITVRCPEDTIVPEGEENFQSVMLSKHSSACIDAVKTGFDIIMRFNEL